MITVQARANPQRRMLVWATLPLLALIVLGLAARSEASTAANTIIRNTVTVNYKDDGGTAQTAITAQVDITVNLVPASPTLNAPTDISTTPATSAVYNYTLTTNANGPDSYNLTEVTLTPSAGVNGAATAFSATPITLGASTVAAADTIAAGGTTDITVPSDLAGDAAVNGIAAGDTVVINAQVFTVAAVTDNGGTPGTSIIQVNGNGTPTAIAVGDLIRERKTFTLTVSWTSITASTNQTVGVTIGARDSGAVAAQVTDDTVTTITVPSLTVAKFVANITVPVVGGGSTVTIDTGGGAGSTTYYTTGVSGKPGDTLEYVIRIVNGAGASDANDIKISDPVPPFTTYTAGSMRLDPGTAVFAGVTDAADDGNGGETDGNTIYIYAGSGGTDATAGVGNGTGGTLPASTTTYGVFRVTINN